MLGVRSRPRDGAPACRRRPRRVPPLHRGQWRLCRSWYLVVCLTTVAPPTRYAGRCAKGCCQQDGTSAYWQLVGGVPVQRYDTGALWQSVAGIRRQQRPVGNGVCHPRTVCRQQHNGAGFHAQPEWAMELFLTSRCCGERELPGDGVEPSVHGFTDRCLDHLATLGCKGFRAAAARLLPRFLAPMSPSRVLRP
jgi:hypothetical protein